MARSFTKGPCMRQRRNRKQETRDALLRSSSAIAKKHGFECSGIDRFMGAIGMAGGTFYSHFESKDALFAVLVERELRNSWDMLSVGKDASGADFDQRMRAYLSSTHVLQPEFGCAMTSLAAEIARAGPAIRMTAERGLTRLHRDWRSRLGGDGERCWTLLAQCVGAVTLARMVESGSVRSKILTSSLHAALRSFDALRKDQGIAGEPRPARARDACEPGLGGKAVRRAPRPAPASVAAPTPTPRTPPRRRLRAARPPARWMSSPGPTRWRRRPAMRPARWRC